MYLKTKCHSEAVGRRILSEGCASEIGAAFDTDPQGLLEALTPETEELQNQILYLLLYVKATEAQRKDVVEVVEGLLNQNTHSPEETALLENLIAYAKTWHVGDSFPPEPTAPPATVPPTELPVEAPTQAPTEPFSQEKGPALRCLAGSSVGIRVASRIPHPTGSADCHTILRDGSQ